MRRIRLGSSLYAEMDDSGNWTSELKPFAKHLTNITKIELGRVSVADGDPLAVVFQRIVTLLNPTEVTTANLPSETEERIY